MAPSRFDRLQADRLHRRRQAALAFARSGLDLLARYGAEARIVGSLARGDYGLASDVDFLLVRCPDQLRYSLESRLEDVAPDGLAFDLIYLDEVAEPWRGRLLAEAVAEVPHADR